MTSECCSKSCWCAPCRWIVSCFPCCKPKPKQTSRQYAVNNVSIAILVSPTLKPVPAHHRERTWKLSDGKMTYEAKDIESM